MGSKRKTSNLVFAIRFRATMVFRDHPDAAEKISDAISVGWQMSLTAPDSVPDESLAFYAVRRVSSGRQFNESSRSIDGPNPRRRKKPRRQPAEMGRVLGKRGENPADLARVLVDYAEWCRLLTPREREFLEAFIRGDKTTEIAARFRVSKARVSQMRRELATYWKDFTAAE
jgi:DNA-binding NarL/FixJ family response regulator